MTSHDNMSELSRNPSVQSCQDLGGIHVNPSPVPSSASLSSIPCVPSSSSVSSSSDDEEEKEKEEQQKESLFENKSDSNKDNEDFFLFWN